MMFNQSNPVAQWAFDAHAHQISAVDQQGRVLMAIAANPMFGTRLAAAFAWPAGHYAAQPGLGSEPVSRASP